jgi:hypothetical protein
VRPAWLSANGSAVLQMARALSVAPDLAAMPVLADALEEAGCADAHLLEYCREPGTENCARWLVALLVGAAVPGEG